MNLFVGNLSAETTDDDLHRLFSEFGKVASARIVKDHQTGESRKFGFVEMPEKFEAFDAIDNLDLTYFQGQIIAVSEAKGKTSGGQQRRKEKFTGNKPAGRPPGGNRLPPDQ